MRPATAISDILATERVANMLHETANRVVAFKTTMEPLVAMLNRLGDEAFRLHTSDNQKPISAKTEISHQDYMKDENISATDLAVMDAMRPTLTNLIGHRATQVTILKLATMTKKNGWRWDHDLLLVTAGQSVSYMKVRNEIFPTLTPTSPYVVVRNGSPSLASGVLHLAVQGIHAPEFDFLGLAGWSETMQRELAGNVFTANACVANILAVMLEIWPHH